MSTFNLTELIDGHDKTEIAKCLFPENQHPRAALERVLKGESFLNTQQLKWLASYLGVPVAGLFNGGWAMLSENGTLTFVKDSYKVYVNYNGSFIEVTKNNETVNRVILNIKAMSLCEFINYLNKLTDGTN